MVLIRIQALGVMLISSPEFYCSNEILSITALLSVPQIFVRPANNRKAADDAKDVFAHPDGDHLTMLNVYHAFKGLGPDENPQEWCWENFVSYRSLAQADDVRQQLKRLMEREEVQLVSTDFEDPRYYDNIRRALVSGFFQQVAKRDSSGKAYTTVKDDQTVVLHPSTVLKHESDWVLYNEFVLTSRNYIRTVTAIKPEWLLEISPVYFDLSTFKKGDIKNALQRTQERMKRLGGKQK